MSPASVPTGALHSGFLRSSEDFSDRLALEVAGSALTYRELRDRAQSLAATIQRRGPKDGAPLTGVFAMRSVTAFTGILGALLGGHGYVPLNRSFPVERTRRMIERADCRVIIVDAAASEQLAELLAGLSGPRLFVLPERSDLDSMRQAWPQHSFLGCDELDAPSGWTPCDVPADSIAYLLFTSGSTGVPKGVGVTHGNVLAFLDSALQRYGIDEHDRFSQTFDTTFDLSVFDMFMAWSRGACLCCPSARTLINPGKFIRDSSLTVWFSVPSTGVFMRQLGALKPGRYPTLRWSLFCGEPLPVSVARAWADAASNSRVENLYGPTEVTIACTVYRWDPEHSPGECAHDVVPIGAPLPGMSTLIVDERAQEVAAAAEGELLMGGPQVTPGYWRDEERTRASFIRVPGFDGVFYRTGDVVRRATPNGPLLYLRRADHQLKIQGHRVELGEVEAVLRQESGVDAVIALGWPLTESGAGGIEAFLGDLSIESQALLERVAARLPDYMVPRRLHLLSTLPLNPNGKFDRNALLRMLKEMQ